MEQPQTIVVQAPIKPNTNMALAVITTFCCNPLFGIVAWIFSCMSSNAWSDGDIEGARSKGKTSMWISIAGIILAILIAILVPVIFYLVIWKSSNDAANELLEKWANDPVFNFDFSAQTDAP